MNPFELLAVAAITIASRVAALAVAPAPTGRLEDVVERLPAPLYAALAAFSFAGVDGALKDPALIAGLVAAVLASRWSSMPITLGCGIGAFLTVTSLT